MAFVTDVLDRILSRVFPRFMNRFKIDLIVSRERRRRPHPHSLWTGQSMGPPTANLPPYCDKPAAPAPVFHPSDYVSWPSLADRSYTGRHLPPNEASTEGLPSPEEVFNTIFLRKGQMRPCKKTTALFCFFAQWFTDSFLRTHPCDRRRHTGNNEIDYCQIYGLDEATALVLRTRRGGLMHVRGQPGSELLPFLVQQDDPHVGAIDPRFLKLPYIDEKEQPPGKTCRERIGQSLSQAPLDPDRWMNMYATGLDRGNSTIFYTALSTMCVREHNRLARALAAANPPGTTTASSRRRG